MKLKLADSRKSYRNTKISCSETLEIQPESNKKKSYRNLNQQKLQQKRKQIHTINTNLNHQQGITIKKLQNILN